MEYRMSFDQNELEKNIEMKKLTPAQIEEALIRISDEEMLQIERPIHSQLVDECHSMIYRLNGKEMPSDCVIADSLARVSRNIEKKTKLRASMMYGLKVVAAVVLITVTAIIHDSVANRILLRGETIENGEQYRIEGRQASETFIEESSADAQRQTIQLSTKEISEVSEVLGSMPKMPSWVPEGWEVSHYFLMSTEETVMFTVTYKHPEHLEVLVYSSKFYCHPDNAADNFEQDGEGIYEIWGGQDVYLTANMGYNTVIWVNGETSYNVGGPISFEELRRFYESIQ